MSVFSRLTDIEVNVVQGQDTTPLIGMLQTLYGGAEPINHAMSAVRGKALIQLNEVTEQPEREGRLIQSITAQGCIGMTPGEALEASIELSKGFANAPVTLSGNDKSVVVTGDERLSTALKRWRSAPEGGSFVSPSV